MNPDSLFLHHGGALIDRFENQAVGMFFQGEFRALAKVETFANGLGKDRWTARRRKTQVGLSAPLGKRAAA
jgi:hypothetical protein